MWKVTHKKLRKQLLTFVIGKQRAEQLPLEDAASTFLALATAGLGFVGVSLTLVFAWPVFDAALASVAIGSLILFACVWPLYRWVVPTMPGAATLANHFIPAGMYISCGFAAVYAAGALPLASIYAPAIPLLSVMICGKRGAIVWSILMALTFVAAILFGPLNQGLAPAPPWMSLVGGLTVLIPTLISMLIHRSVWAQAVDNERQVRQELASQHALQRDLDKRLSEHERAESLSLMAGRVAHDLNNFLTSASGNAALASYQLEAGLNEEAAQSVAAIDQAAQVASDLARQLLNYSGRRHLTMASINVGERLEAALVLVRAAVKEGVRVELECQQDIWIHGDPTQLDQVVVNLTRNAAESYPSKAGEHLVTVRVSVKKLDQMLLCAMDTQLQPGEYALLEVRDYGAGIPADIAARVFEPFYTTKPEGKGLGLASVAGIVKAHGGGIVLTSSPSGTTVSVLLPLQEAPLDTVAQIRVAENPSSVANTRVLVADDQAEVRKVVGRLAARAGLNPDYAADGQEALDMLLRSDVEYALAILDISMPRLDGASVLRMLRDAHSHVPVLLISGYANAASTTVVHTDRHAIFLQKPFSAQAFHDALAGLGVNVLEIASGE